MNNTQLLTSILFLTFLVACTDKNPKGKLKQKLKVIEAQGFVVPINSIAKPKVTFVNESNLKKIPCGIPKVDSTNTNIHSAINTNKHKAGIPKESTPGIYPFLLPKIETAIDSLFVAGLPKIIIVKDAYTKDQNPHNFSSFKKLQGLNSGNVFCLFEDKVGYLWIGTDGGVIKYDGKNFTFFTKKEGLCDNNVKCIQEDQFGNIWLGTDRGITKYDGKNFTYFIEKNRNKNNIKSILEDKQGNIWFSNEGYGVTKYDGNRIAAIERGDKIPLSDQQDLKKINGKFIKTFTYFSTKEGLSNDTIFKIFEDKSGNIWFGTIGSGVSKYDGKKFTHFTKNEGLTNNTISNILEDKLQNIWFCTEGGGVSKYDGKDFTNFTEKEGISKNLILSVLEDNDGNLWFGSYGGGLTKYNGKIFTHFTEKEGLSNNRIACSLKDKYGNLWFGSYGGGLTKYNGKIFTHFTEKEGLNLNVILSSIEDKKGSLWFGTYGGGITKYDEKNFTHFTEKEGLSNNIVLCSIEDRDGNLWFGYNKSGVSKFDGNRVDAIERGDQIPLRNQQNLKKVKGKLVKTFTHLIEKEGLGNFPVRTIFEDKYGNLWFGTAGGGVIKYDGNRVEAIERGDQISKVEQEDLKRINGKLVKSLTHYTKKEGLSSNIVYTILEDKDGNLWFGTGGGGLTKYDGKNFTHFTEKEGLINNLVFSSIKDKYENIWFSTDGGITKYDGKKFTYFTEKEGLGSNCVYSSLADKNGNLWFGTRLGLSKLSNSILKETSTEKNSKSTKEITAFFKNYNYDDGFLGIGCSINSICETKDGTIWTGTNDRLTAYHPIGQNKDTIAPNIQLISVALFNENINWTNLETQKDSILTLGSGVSVSDIKFNGIKKWYNVPENLSLAHNNNYLTFNFIGITLAYPKKVRYQYKLEEIEENWSALTDKTEVSYGNLSHGNYTFKVKAMNSEGFFSNELSYTFTIRPPWWKTWWFKILVGLIIICSIIFYVKWRERALKLKNEILEKTVQERTVEVIEQKKRIEEKHKEITDSINYAERIQRSFLATRELLDENLLSYFIFFQPKDVVSGDFYWAAKLSNGNFVLVTADSTGHGVPGAIMSILNISCLEKAIETLIQPAAIFNSTRKTIIDRLKKDGSAEGGKDGMDASLICFDFLNLKFVYAAANNPIWVVRQNNLIKLKPDKMPVGKHDKDQISFTQCEFDLEKNDVVYTFTDGFQDQFGGGSGKKFMTKQLKELLISIAPLNMKEQNEILKSTLNKWKGELEQVDDVCLIGVRI